ncbi:MAG TPA: ABC transporter permease subunit [Chloroflexota bacterium]
MSSSMAVAGKGLKRRKRESIFRFETIFPLFSLILVLYIVVPPITLLSLSISDRFDLLWGFLPMGLTFEMYTAWADVVFQAMISSLMIAIPTGILTLFIGLPVAYALVRLDFPGKMLINELVLLPMIFPPIILAFGLFQLFQTGAFRDIGVLPTLVMAHTVVSTPFLIRPVVAALQRVEVSFEEAAHSLGASRLRAFLDIVMPVVLPALMTGVTLVIARSISDFEITLLLTNPDYTTLPIAIYQAFETGKARLGAAVAIIANIFSILLVIGLEGLIRRSRWW